MARPDLPARPVTRPHRLPRIACSLAVCASVLGLSGCQSVLSDTSTVAEVRFIDTSVDAPALDLYLNGNGAAYNVAYATYSSYLPVTPGVYHLNAMRAGTAQALVSAHATLLAARQYTAVVSSRLGTLRETIYADTVPAVHPGMAAVRVLNALDAPPVDVYLVGGTAALATTSPAISDLAYTAEAGYLQVPAGAYTLATAPTGAPATSATPVSGAVLTAAAGAVRTVVLSEPSSRAARTGQPAAYALVLDDADTP